MHEAEFDQQKAMMLEALRAVDRRGDFRVLNETGASCIVFENSRKPGSVYKVFRPGLPNSIEHARVEYGTGCRLFRKGDKLGPKMIKFHGKNPPIIEMERINGRPATKQQIIASKEMLLRVFSQLKMIPGDIEFLWDQDENRIRVIDVFSLTDARNYSYPDRSVDDVIREQLDSIIRTDGVI